MQRIRYSVIFISACLLVLALALLLAAGAVDAQAAVPTPTAAQQAASSLEQRVNDAVIIAIIAGATPAVFILVVLVFRAPMQALAGRIAKFIPGDAFKDNPKVTKVIEDSAREQVTSQTEFMISTIKDTFQKQIDFVLSEFDHAQKRADISEQERRDLAAQFRQMQTDRLTIEQSTGRKMSELERQVIGLEGKLQTLSTERDSAVTERDRAWAQVDSLRQELKTTNEHLEQTRQQLGKVQQDLARLEGERAVMQTLLDRIQPVQIAVAPDAPTAE